ncbi:UNVERIFIED_CONTAM: hypothetical protein PYX00_007734 [Menopon gallinae]|uniref:HTH CENPB-type domain-containing protein n=1 Tax=Menopon gallinae TaxID=328185 RepID=A0AAW2HKU3_9NEOP
MGGKRKSLDMKTRQEIVNMLQKKSGTAADLAAKYGVAVSTITRIWRKRDEIERYLRTNQDEQRKRIKFAKHRDIEEAVSSWFAEMRERNADVNGVLIKKKAKEFAEKLNVPFKASNGWLQRWKCRNGFGKKEPEQLPTEEVVRDPEELENDLISKKNAYKGDRRSP